MIKKQVIGKMSPEVHNEVRAACVRHDALKINPNAYSSAESEQIIMGYYRATARMLTEMSVEVEKDYEFSPGTGVIWYNEEF